MSKITIEEIYMKILGGECINWNVISKDYDLDSPFIEEFYDKVNWNLISRYQQLSEKDIEKFKKYINWHIISKNQKLSQGFIYKHRKRLNWIFIFLCQKIEESFILSMHEYVPIKMPVQLLLNIQKNNNFSTKFIQKWIHLKENKDENI